MSNALIASIQIFCPICRKMGVIDVEEKLVNQSTSGITAINVLQKLVCVHSFVAYIDCNYSVRDCFVCDFKVKLPQIEMQSITSGPPIDIDLIKYNIIPSLMANILTGVHYNRKLLVINELEFLNEIFSKFFDYVFQDSFKHEISFISETEYNKNKKLYKKYLVLKGNEIISDKKKMIDNKKTKIYNSIIQKFFSENDNKLGILILKNEINKLYILSETLMEMNENLSEFEDFTSKKAIMHVNKKYKTKIPYPYVNLLMDIIECYFNVKLKKASKSGDLLELI